MSDQDRYVTIVGGICSVIVLVLCIIDMLFLPKFSTLGKISRKSILVPQGTQFPVPINQDMPSCCGVLYIKCEEFPEVRGIEVCREMYNRVKVGDTIGVTYTKGRIFSDISISIPGAWPTSEPEPDYICESYEDKSSHGGEAAYEDDEY